MTTMREKMKRVLRGEYVEKVASGEVERDPKVRLDVCGVCGRTFSNLQGYLHHECEPKGGIKPTDPRFPHKE